VYSSKRPWLNDNIGRYFMESFAYYSPVHILFGPGKRHDLGSLLKNKYQNVLLVMSKGPFRENGAYGDIKKSIEDAHINLFEMDDIDSNPKLYSARQGVSICQEHNIDCIIAMGGGSAMDCGKIIGAAAKMKADPFDLIWGERLSVTTSLDVITIPTFAATGTEVNNAAVMVDETTHEKYWAITKFPNYAIMDPELTLSVPLELTIWGAMDILSHTFEYYFNGNTSSEFQLCFSEALISSIMTTVDKLIADPDDLNARGELMWEAVMAWGGLTKIGQGDPDMACHSIEESFSGYFDTHHGACLSILTPNWMKIAYKRAPAAFARFGRNLFALSGDDETVAEEAVKQYLTWLKSIEAPQSYSDIAKPDQVITVEELKKVAETAFTVYDGQIGKLVSFSLDEVKELLRAGLIPYSHEEL
jgi:alcohol dehydrogenase